MIVHQFLHSIQVKLVDDKGEIVPVNTRGRIMVRGYSLFKGYWQDEKKTKDAIDEIGWLNSRQARVLKYKLLKKSSAIFFMHKIFKYLGICSFSVIYQCKA